MKDGRTHLAYKAEHVVDLQSDLVVAADIRPADHADTETIVDNVMLAQANLQVAGSQATIEEVAADKGYHAAHTLELAEAFGLRTYVPEPRRKHRRRWSGKPRALQGEGGLAALMHLAVMTLLWFAKRPLAPRMAANRGSGLSCGPRRGRKGHSPTGC